MGMGRKDSPERPMICLSPEGGIVVAYGDFQPPMYKAPLEVMEVIKLIIEERTRTQVDYFRSPERGFFEMTQKCAGSDKVLFRMWPVFFDYNRRLDYKIYEQDPEIRAVIEYYLEICARMNDARLFHKE